MSAIPAPTPTETDPLLPPDSQQQQQQGPGTFSTRSSYSLPAFSMGSSSSTVPSDRRSINSIDSQESKAHLGMIRRNLVSSRSSILAQVGIIGMFFYVVWRIMTSDIIFFTGHPALNNFAILMLVQSIILVQPTATTAEKQLGAMVHGLFNLFGAICYVMAFGIVFINKTSNGGAHIHSAHAAVGLLTYVILLVNVIIGFTQYWMPGIYGSVTRAKSLYKYHRVLGYIGLFFSFLATGLATITPYNRNVLGIRFPIILGFMIATALGLAIRIRPHKFQGLRFKLRRN
ncbi:hypothetical protein BZA70DRAFT_283529 [Myxozyma melibiosi]|uniref:Cytochrome b561 domain-containing protein n=1 Tax=Myxozyma melibiosi TaxID=54550 RepID=A0ABR1F0L6_9ASCO